MALHKRRSRAEAGVTVVEGYDELSLAVEVGVVPTTLYFCPELVTDDRADLVDRIAALGSEVVRLSRTAYEKVSYRDSPDGFLAVVPDPTRNARGARPAGRRVWCWSSRASRSPATSARCCVRRRRPGCTRSSPRRP